VSGTHSDRGLKSWTRRKQESYNGPETQESKNDDLQQDRATLARKAIERRAKRGECLELKTDSYG